MKILLIGFSSLLAFSVSAFAGHHEEGEKGVTTAIGSYITDKGNVNPIYAGDTSRQQIWIDYIDAHNDRNLEVIAEINTADWAGYREDGSLIDVSDAHIAFLDDWFKSAQNPKWVVRWMIANGAKNDDGVMENWLTTGNDFTFVDENGQEVTQHHVHDVQFIGRKIKLINVYSRPAPAE